MNKEIIIQGERPVDTVLLINEGEFTPSKDVQSHIAQFWERFKQKYPRAFSGPMLRLHSWMDDHNKLLLKTQSTDYAAYIGTRDRNFRERYSENDCAKPLGMTVIPVTEEGKIVVTRRSLRLEQNPGSLYFIGGYIESGVDKFGTEVTIWQDIKREVKEELNVEGESIKKGTFLGVAYDPSYFHPEVFVKLHLNKTAKEVLELWLHAQDKEEAEEILVFDQESLLKHYRNNTLPYPLTWSFKTGIELGFKI